MTMLRHSTRLASTTRRLHRGGGFSLVELIAVMVLMAILAAAAVPAWTGMTQRRAGVAAQQLQRDLSFARQWAVASGSRCWTQFDMASQRWSIHVEVASSPGIENAIPLVDPATGIDHVQQLDAGDFAGVTVVSVNLDGQEWIGFDWIGSPLVAEETSPGVFDVQPLASVGSVELSSGHVVTVEPESGAVATTGGGGP